jgi:methylphosphotriester-DNA--protein-cysteine methyltransferase
MTDRAWRLLGPDGSYDSEFPGTLGGHRSGGIYGRLDCPAAARAIAKGGYVQNRVFFADAADAVACGYRPCATCLPQEYRAWRERTTVQPPAVAGAAAASPETETRGRPYTDIELRGGDAFVFR